MKITHCKLNWCLAGKQNNRGTERKNRKKKKIQTNKQTDKRTVDKIHSGPEDTFAIFPSQFSYHHARFPKYTNKTRLPLPSPHQIQAPHTPPLPSLVISIKVTVPLSLNASDHNLADRISIFSINTHRDSDHYASKTRSDWSSLSLSNLTTVFYFFGPKKSLTTTTTANIFLGFYRFF